MIVSNATVLYYNKCDKQQSVDICSTSRVPRLNDIVSTIISDHAGLYAYTIPLLLSNDYPLITQIPFYQL